MRRRKIQQPLSQTEQDTAAAASSIAVFLLDCVVEWIVDLQMAFSTFHAEQAKNLGIRYLSLPYDLLITALTMPFKAKGLSQSKILEKITKPKLKQQVFNTTRV